MAVLQIMTTPSALYQQQVINLGSGDLSRRVIFELRYFYKTDKWYISMSDAQTGETICTCVPVIASYSFYINLLEPYYHKGIGWIMCVPVVDEPSSENPGRNNLDEFALFWGDEFE